MKREIKLKIWDTEEKKFLTEAEVQLVHDTISWGTEFFLEVKVDFEKYDPTRYIYCESTGLKDKNGKEIYEGDILERMGKKYTVVYWQASFTLRENGTLEDLRAFVNSDNETPLAKVIGNIYENPELLFKHTK